MTDLRAPAYPLLGTMTSVMRILPPASELNLLRVGLLAQGRMVDERLMKHRADVTLGSSEHCTFVLAEPCAAGSLRVLEFDGTSYALRLVDGITCAYGAFVLTQGRFMTKLQGVVDAGLTRASSASPPLPCPCPRRGEGTPELAGADFVSVAAFALADLGTRFAADS